MLYYWGNGGIHWWDWFLMGLGMVAFWGVLIWLVVSLVRSGTTNRMFLAPPGDDTPEAILKRRFAAGEIDADEYRHRLDVLRGHERVGTG